MVTYSRAIDGLKSVVALRITRRTLLTAASFLLLILTTSCSDDGGGSERLYGTPSYGVPYKVDVAEVDNSKTNIAFAIIADTHLDPGCTFFNRYSDKTVRNQTIVEDLNIDCRDANCLGIVHLGDMVDGNKTHYLIGFRQLWENDYPGKDRGDSGCYDDYSDGQNINYPVFPTVGNHDNPTFDSGDKDWYEAIDYINARIKDAPGILHQYDKVSYTWRWGQYFFIQLGLWAGSYEYESAGATDKAKLRWLKNVLDDNVRDENLGVFIFQHYGWDGFSVKKNEKGNAVWWSLDQRNLELNVLCGNAYWDSTSPCNPYNIMGIFTGHNHSQEFLQIDAGKDKDGNVVRFDNYVMLNSGAQAGTYGFSIVHLDEKTMNIKTKDEASGTWSWYPDHPNNFRHTIGWNLEKTTGIPYQWTPLIIQPNITKVAFGGGAAVTQIDNDDRQEIIMMGIDAIPGGNKRFYYRIGWNLQPAGGFNSVSECMYSPHIGNASAGGGAFVTQIDDDSDDRPDLVLMYIDAPPDANEFRYIIGWNLDSDGKPDKWSELIRTYISPNWTNAGGGAAIADIDNNGRPDMVFMAIDAPDDDSPNEFRYVIGWNLDSDGKPDKWSELIYTNLSPGWITAGGGAAIANIDDNPNPDMVFMAIDAPDGPNEFRYVIGWNLDSDGKPEKWSELIRTNIVPSYYSAGAGAVLADFDNSGKPDMLLMDIDNPY